jgi:hypothetical protein
MRTNYAANMGTKAQRATGPSATYEVGSDKVVRPMQSTANPISSRMAPGARNTKAKREGDQVARSMTKAVGTQDTLIGRGLTTMRENKVKTGMVVASGMGVAAAVRSTGPGTSKGSQSLYRY